MRKIKIFRISVIVVVVCLLSYLLPVQLAVAAGQAQALGHVIAKLNTVSIGNNSIPSGTTLFSGDMIQVANSAAILNLSNGGRIQMNEGSKVDLRGDNQTTTLNNLYGTAKFNVPGNTSLVVSTSAFTVRTASTGSTFAGQISVDKGSLTLLSERGEFFIVDNSTSQTHAVKEGELAQVERGTAAKGAAKDPAEGKGKSGASTSTKAGVTSGTTKAGAVKGGVGGLFGMGTWATVAVVAGVAAAAIAVPLAITASSSTSATPSQ